MSCGPLPLKQRYIHEIVVVVSVRTFALLSLRGQVQQGRMCKASPVTVRTQGNRTVTARTQGKFNRTVNQLCRVDRLSLGKSVHKRKRRDNCIGTSEDPAVAAGTVAGTRSVQRPSKLRKYQSKLVARLAVTNFGCFGVLMLVSGTQPLVPPSDVAHCTFVCLWCPIKSAAL